MSDNSIDDLFERLSAAEQKEIHDAIKDGGYRWESVSYTLQKGIEEFAKDADIYISPTYDDAGCSMGVGIKYIDSDKAHEAKTQLVIHLIDELGREITEVVSVYEEWKLM